MKIRYCLMLFVFMMQSLAAAPVVDNVCPSNGTVIGANVVTINGSGFTDATSVTFGARPAMSYTVVSDGVINATVPAGTVGTVDVIVTAGDASAQSSNDYYTYTDTGWQGIISSILPEQIYGFNTTSTASTFITPLPAESLASVITPDGTRIYTANTTPAGVTVIDRATNSIITTITIPGEDAFDIIVNPAGTRIYVSSLTSGTVTVVDATTNTVVTNIELSAYLGPLAITPDGSTVLVSDFTSGQVTAIDTATNAVLYSVATGTTPGMISITQDGTQAFVANLGSDTVSVVSLVTHAVTDTITLPEGSGPYGSTLLPNGTTLYVININAANVSVIDVATKAITTTIALEEGSQPFWAVSTPDSNKVFIINQSNSQVVPIDTTTNVAGTPFSTNGASLQDIVMSSDPSPVASFTVTPQLAGLPTNFDASASLSPIGVIVSYAWDFGDGETETVTTPLISHTYAAYGTYDVTLTVTNSAGTSTTKVFSSRFMSNDGGPKATLIKSVTTLPEPPQPPKNLVGVQRHCCFWPKSHLVNVLNWEAPDSGSVPVGYKIYRDVALRNLVATLTNEEFTYIDEHPRRNRIYTYYVVSVDATGAESAPAVVIIHPHH